MKMIAPLILALIGCPRLTAADSGYLESIEAWHQHRVQSLTRPDGWLSLSGLFWLKQGENSFGSDLSNDIRFPQEKCDPFIGIFLLQGDSVEMVIRPEVDVRNQGQTVQRLRLRSDQGGSPTVLIHHSLSWHIIYRDGRFAVRLKDGESTALKGFRGIERFPVDEKWAIEAVFIKSDSGSMLQVPTILGSTSQEATPGLLEFIYEGQRYSLHVLGNEPDEDLFIVFGDAGNGEESYGGGRFLSVKRPDQEGRTIIDFNRAYNPPCAFTPYATCPLPPVGNMLPFKVTAGEKAYNQLHH